MAEIYGDLINARCRAREDMTVTMNLCRGNYKATFGIGGYEPVAECWSDASRCRLLHVYDPSRRRLRPSPACQGSGSAGPGDDEIRRLESKDALRRRIDEAAKFVPLDQLCLSGQCGFASTEEGNTLTEDAQWRKLERIVEVSKEVWG